MKDVKSVHAAYSAEKLEEMWQYEEYVMSEAARDGGNE